MNPKRLRFQRSQRIKKSIFAILLILILVQFIRERAFYSSVDPILEEGTFQVQRVVDGDTLLLTNGSRVRLMGVDTPECVKPNWPVEPFGPEASAYVKKAVAESQYLVKLRLDREREDKYGRKLAYVYVFDPNQKEYRLLNEELIRLGLGRALLTFNYTSSMKKRFERAQTLAQQESRGIWSLPQKAPKPDKNVRDN